MSAQVNLMDKIYVDCFAGGGGWSTGFELAAGRPINIAINHDLDAIRMHRTNHPYTEHYQEDVFLVDPKTATHGQEVGWAHFSPDCKHFSRAKGGPLVDRKIRGLAWVVLHWADQVRPDIISLENVVEFQTWGPLMEVVANGRRGTAPDPERAGEYFEAFIGMLTTGVEPDCPALAEVCEALHIPMDGSEARRLIHGLGYQAEWRELVAADFGAPTTRKRFFLLARCDGKPIVWPKATHAHRDSEGVKSGGLKPWRSAAEIIDWSIPCPSIFEDKAAIKAKYGITAIRPLADNTQQRVARGVDKFVIKSSNPFIIQVNHSGDFRGKDLEKPLQTVTAKHGYGVADPIMAPITFSNTGGSSGVDAGGPTHTIRTAGGQILTTPILTQYHTEKTGAVRGQPLTGPLMTVDGAGRYALTAPIMVKYYGGDTHGQRADNPLHTITTRDREGLTAVNLVKFYGGVVGAHADQPLPTVTACDHNALQLVHLSEFYGTSTGARVGNPLHTITAHSNHHGLVVTTIAKAEPGASLHHWPKIRAMLNRYCDYKLAEDEVILFWIAGAWWYMADIGLRMLTPRELYRAQGFPEDYIIDHDYEGNAYGKTKQVARCGNAVPPPFATALVRANMPEVCCMLDIRTMAELMKEVAV